MAGYVVGEREITGRFALVAARFRQAARCVVLTVFWPCAWGCRRAWNELRAGPGAPEKKTKLTRCVRERERDLPGLYLYPIITEIYTRLKGSDPASRDWAGLGENSRLAPIHDAMADTVTELVLGLTNPALKEQALLKLSKEREGFPNLAPYLWHSFGTMSSLLQEIVSIYPMLQPPSLTAHASNRVCNALALLQCVASHPDTRTLFLKAHIPLFLYPFLNTVSKTRPFEYLRLTSLGVVGALVKVDDPEVISFLLSTEIIPLCLRTMESGSELSKTVATFIVQKILLVRLIGWNGCVFVSGVMVVFSLACLLACVAARQDNAGLAYICATAERFFAVSAVLSSVVQGLQDQSSVRLLKHIVRCYLRLSENSRAREALRQCLPDGLRNLQLTACLKDDVATRRWLAQLLLNVGFGADAALLGVPDVTGPTPVV